LTAGAVFCEPEVEDEMAPRVNTTVAATEGALRGFLGAGESSRRFRLILPEFGGSARLNDEASGSGFSYRGNTFAERDTRAASHVQALLDQVVDIGNVTLEGTGTGIEQEHVSFLFGSRSNRATQTFLQEVGTGLFQFAFTDTWTILCAGQRFSLPDPTILDPVQYAAADDYGVIARVRSAASAPVFMIAGLGGRATEGCGLYFREHWVELDRAFGSQDFALVLKFSAPFDVNRVEQVASAWDVARAF